MAAFVSDKAAADSLAAAFVSDIEALEALIEALEALIEALFALVAALISEVAAFVSEVEAEPALAAAAIAYCSTSDIKLSTIILSAFNAKASITAVERGLSKSLVLSTNPKSICSFVTV